MKPAANGPPFPPAGDVPDAFHIMLKPRGAICNLNCQYCYYLSKEELYPGSPFRMDHRLLESYTRQYIGAQRTPEITFAWQGGEPTLMGLDFFQAAVQLQQKYKKPGTRIQNALQTNGVTLDEEWCRFFKQQGFLVGVSLDGPRPLHDAYRVDKGGRPTFDRVMEGVACLHKHKVDFNILTTVHAVNVSQPLDVYRFLRDEVQAEFIQLIPIVERENSTGFQEGNQVTARSVSAAEYGRFLIEIFDEWVRHDVGQVYVQLFDVALNAWLGLRPGLCVFEETCGNALALEHNGDLYSCDHFVERGYKLGNILDDLLLELVASDQQRQFGRDKRESLPRYCRACDVRFVCHGGCPKNRFIYTPPEASLRHGEPGLNYLCAGYKAFFQHIDEPMRFMSRELRTGRAPGNVMSHMDRKDAAVLERRFASAGRNDPCPCGSGRKFKNCHRHTR